jgi:arylsulfatase A-like enzyme
MKSPLTLPLVLLLGFGAPNLHSDENPRDILFIAIDDLNDWTGLLKGHPQAKTPNLDRLMERGMTFTNAHCAAPACNPSRAALMSGLRPFETGIYTNSLPAAPVLKKVTTINRHFLASGYRTVGAGKIYHGYNSEGREDTWSEWVGHFSTDGKQPANLNGLNRAQFDWGPLSIPPEGMRDYKLTDWAIGELNKPSDEPLFLAVGYVKPHLPWYVPQEYFDRFPLEEIILPETAENDLSDIPPAGVKMAKPEGDHAAVLGGDEWEKAVQGYLATNSFLDDQIGRLLEGLEQSPRGQTMAVVLWSDHGWHLGEKEHWRKFTLWEEATRCVFAISIPGVTKAGSSCRAPVDFMSVYPTVCEIAGLPIPEHVKGPSLLPLLKDPRAKWNRPALTTHGRGNHGVRSPRYRYIRYEDGSEELYFHEDDPLEANNRANDTDPEIAEIKTKLGRIIPKKEVPPAGGGIKKKGKASR